MMVRTLDLRRGTYIAVQHDGGWWLAQLYTHVYSDSKVVRICWFDQNSKSKEYKRHVLNDIPADTVICRVRVKRISKTPYIIAIDDKEISNIEETMKKKNVPPKKKIGKSSPKKDSPGKKRKTQSVGGKPSKIPKLDLAIPTLTKNPYFEEDVPMVSPTVNSLLIHRAVSKNNIIETRKLFKDKNNISFPFISYKSAIYKDSLIFKDAIYYAIDKRDLKLVKMLVELRKGVEKMERVEETKSLLQVLNTGVYNPTSLGVRAIRALTMSRGSRQGVEAFEPLKSKYSYNAYKYVEYAVRDGCSVVFFNSLMRELSVTSNMTEAFVTAVRCGNAGVAAEIVTKETMSGDNTNFNQLHKEVLSHTTQNLTLFKAASCHKKTGHDLKRITPLHCSAINPNPKYLKQLLQTLPEVEIEDMDYYKLVHYAAVCSNDANLKLLITFKVDLLRRTPSGVTALMRAAKVGAVHNIRTILNYAKAQLNTDESDDMLAQHQQKVGLGGLNQAILKGPFVGHTALTLAVVNNKHEAVKLLLEYGADVKKCLGAAKKKMSPLMIAASMGNLEICQTLFLAGSKLKGKDRHGCTAFHHAVIWNQTHCVSYLLRVGSDLNSVDSSGNTAVQYAAAHGWITCLKFLISLGADVTILNSSGMSALEVAVLRSQIGVVEYLLDLGTVDVNFRNSQGATLVMTLCGADLKSSQSMIEYLINVKHADLSLVDNKGCNALHYLACQNDKDTAPNLIKLVLDKGIDINSSTNDKKTALIIATERKNTYLIPLLIEEGATIIDVKFGNGDNILHYFAKLACKPTSVEVLEALAKNGDENDIKSLLKCENHDGYTPLHLVGKSFSEFKVETRPFWCKETTNDGSRMCGKDFLKMLLDAPFMADCNKQVGMIKKDEEKKADSKVVDDEDENDSEDYDSEDDSSTEELQIVDDREKTNNPSDPRNQYNYHGKWSIVNFVIETIIKSSSEEVITQTLELVLSHHPNLNLPRLDGMYPLHIAIINKKSELTLKLIGHGADVSISPNPGIDKNNKNTGTPPIILAAKHCLELVEPIMKSMESGSHGDKDSILSVLDTDGMNILHHIVSSQNDITTRIRIVEMLLPRIIKGDCYDKLMINFNTDINFTDNRGNSYLHYAVSGIEGGSNISIEIVSLLLQAQADPNLTNHKNQSPLHFAFISNFISNSTFSDPIEVVSILTSVMDKDMINIADSYNGFTPLHLSAMKGGSVTSLHLISHGCDVEAVDNQGNTPLTLAMSGKHQSCVLLILQKGVDFNKCICYPIFRKDPVECKQIVSNDTSKKPWKWDPLKPEKFNDHPTCSKNMSVLYEVIRLQWQGILFTLVDMIHSSFIPLEAAIVLEKFNLAITLLLKYRTNIENCSTLTNNKKRSLIHSLCLTTNTDLKLQERVLNLLIKHGIDINAEDIHGCTALHYACLKKKEDICKILLSSGNVNKEDAFGRSPICALFWNCSPSPEILKHFVDKGADLGVLCDFNIKPYPAPLFGHSLPTHQSNYFKTYDKKVSLLGSCIIRNDKVTLTCLLNHNIPLVADSDSYIPLMYTIQQNDVELSELLLKDLGVDLSHTTKDKNTLIHQCVLAISCAEYSSANILQAVLKEMKKQMTQRELKDILQLKNCSLKTALDECTDKGYNSYSKIISKYLNIQHVKSVLDKTSPIFDCPDFDIHCKEYLTEKMKSLSKTKDIAIPNTCLNLSETDGKVCADDSGRFYDVLMTKIDIRSRVFGIYNFYKLQIVKNVAKNVYILMTKWGRIGDEGQHQQTPFPTFEECLKEFSKVFKAKSKNEWSDIANFINHKGKYRLVSREKRYKNTFKILEYDFKITSPPPTLHPYIIDILHEASNLKTMITMLRDDFKLDVYKLPFGFIESSTLTKAQTILGELGALITKLESITSNVDNAKFNPETYAQITQQIYDLTNEVHYLVPQEGFSVTKIFAIKTDDEVKIWKEKLKNLQQMEIINRVMVGSQLSNTLHPIEYMYKCLKCEITLLEEHAPVTQLILRALHAGSPSAKVIAIYRLNSGNDSELTGDRKLLYHGVNTGALLSILKRGLLNAPFGRAYGAIHGDGVYLTDHFQKSLNYTVAGSDSRFVFLASVRMGKVVTRQDSWDAIIPQHDTLHIKGKLYQDQLHNVQLEGSELSLGNFEKVEDKDNKYRYEHSEYVVKDPAAIKLQYLVQVKN